MRGSCFSSAGAGCYFPSLTGAVPGDSSTLGVLSATQRSRVRRSASPHDPCRRSLLASAPAKCNHNP